MSLGPRLARLEGGDEITLPKKPLEPSACAGCGVRLPGFRKAYGPPDWSEGSDRCEACQVTRMRDLCMAMEEAGFTPAWGVRCLAEELGVSEREALDAALAEDAKSAPTTSRIDTLLVTVARALASSGVDPLGVPMPDRQGGGPDLTQ